MGPGLERALVALAWTAAAVLAPLALLVIEDPKACGDCPDNVVHGWDSQAAADVVDAISVLATIVLLVGLGVLLLRRWRSYGRVQRRALDLQAASARLVAAGDAARRRIERDLHDGAQQRLVSLSVTLNLARKNAEPGSRTAHLLDRPCTRRWRAGCHRRSRPPPTSW